jgi:hypothetical protein
MMLSDVSPPLAPQSPPPATAPAPLPLDDIAPEQALLDQSSELLDTLATDLAQQNATAAA